MSNTVKKCKYCDEVVHGSTHYCRSKGRTLDTDDDDDGDFLISMAIGAATDSAILGGLLGGDMLGGILGDALDGDLFD